MNTSKAKKRRHSDSDTLSPLMQKKAFTCSQKQINPYQDETFSMAVAHKNYPKTLLGRRLMKDIQKEIMNAIKDSKDSEHPQFLGSDFKQGALMITCANVNTKCWLINTVKTLDNFMILTVFDSKKLLKPETSNVYRLSVRIPNPDQILDMGTIRSTLRKQNPKLNIWNIQKMSNEKNEETLIYCDMDYISFLFLEENNFDAFWMLDKITFQKNKNYVVQREIIDYPDLYYLSRLPSLFIRNLE